MRANKTPTGSSFEGKRILEKESAKRSNPAPAKKEHGIKSRWVCIPMRRIVWGIFMPINPTIPATETDIAVSNETNK